MSERRSKVRDLTTYSRRVNLLARVVEMMEPRDVSSSSNGELHRVTEALVGDETGVVLMTLWDEDVGRFSVGDVVEVDNGYAGTFKGRLRLNVGRYGKVEKVALVVGEVDTGNNISERDYGSGFHRSRR